MEPKDDNENMALAGGSISVMAPTDMPGGYEFFADAGNGSSYKVRVPDSGVKSGERFDAIIVQPVGGGAGAGGGHAIPTGRWRDGLCDCFNFGCCHPTFCLGFWCSNCLLGQILTRNKLNCFGSPTGMINPSTYQFWFVMMVVALVTGCASNALSLNQIILFEKAVAAEPAGSTAITPDDLSNYGPAWGNVVMDVFSILTTVFFLLGCVTTCRARKYLREKYEIEPTCCGEAEDCCCAYWCLGCTRCQMARHTADYKQYQASCCSATGLGPQAPEVV